MSKEIKTRRPKARNRDVVFGCLDERLIVLGNVVDETIYPHVERIRELLDELRRSGAKEEAE